jgi:predicted metal-binding integral membrane protein DUF2182
VLGARAWIIGMGILVLAGTYQFMPLKYACLEKCRAPLGFITAYWRGSHAHRQAFRLGLHHGLFCVGCCWSLMLLMFVVGVGNLGWMFVLGVLMALEKNFPWGRRLSVPPALSSLVGGSPSAWKPYGRYHDSTSAKHWEPSLAIWRSVHWDECKAGEPAEPRSSPPAFGVCPSRNFLLINMGAFTVFLIESPFKEYNNVSDTWRL